MERLVNHIVNWLRDYAINAKVNGFVIGVSCGIDSAVTSAYGEMTEPKKTKSGPTNIKYFPYLFAKSLKALNDF